MAKDLSFGTDGWRHVIADQFNFANVGLVARAISGYFNRYFNEPAIAIGYDTRFLSEYFAALAYNIAKMEVKEVLLSDRFITSPILSNYIYKNGLSGGIMVTASHNPYEYNGLKIKSASGGSASPEDIKKVEQMLYEIANGGDDNFFSAEDAFKSARTVDMQTDYFSSLFSRFKQKTVGDDVRVLVDPIFGASSQVLPQALSKAGCSVSVINEKRDPMFGGLNPEPIEKNLLDLIDEVKKKGFDFGVALDGDGDRIGLVDERGRFINSHQIIALCLQHLFEKKKLKGKVIKTVTTSSQISKMADTYGLDLIETPVGFKYIAEEILKGGVLVGGEESGGIWAGHCIPERDGIFISLLIVEMLIESQESLASLFDQLTERFGLYYYEREDIELTSEHKESLRRFLSSKDKVLVDGKELESLNDRDGYKYIFTDGDWLMFRLSGTEMVLRIYAESQDRDVLSSMMKYALSIAKGEI
ncbi:MAG: phosphoglucomutase/phosphomannomutase family protein [Actinobacteria bacterium]|nr:phosphoglucomutase/phosphomannomutase family protein [Actinomycetota bacterium]